MKRSALIVIFVLAVSISGLAQAPDDAIERALVAAPACRGDGYQVEARLHL